MSTRAIYRFTNKSDKIMGVAPMDIYKHHDGYPSSAVGYIQKAVDKATDLDIDAPMGTNKRDLVVMGFLLGNFGYRKLSKKELHGDLDYVYEIERYGEDRDSVTVWFVSHDWDEDTSHQELIFRGTLLEMHKWAPSREYWVENENEKYGTV
tara:strand:+ start:4835 stop:5287 length:453 start_codon:yes stop_codon:yes gene_type:complete